MEESNKNNNAMSLKLLIDTKTNKVLFAEASKSFVDFLFYLLSLPIGTIINLLTTKSTVGSIGNLYKSFADLNETFLQPNLQKNILLNPMPSTCVINDVSFLTASSSDVYDGSSSTVKKFYTCNIRQCRKSVTDKYNPYLLCTHCGNAMTLEMTYISSSYTSTTLEASSGFVKGVVNYMVSDDLYVTPMSMISSISMMNKFKVSKLDVLQEKEVEVGTKEALELLKVSFQSTTVLTDVFLAKKKRKSGAIF